MHVVEDQHVILESVTFGLVKEVKIESGQLKVFISPTGVTFWVCIILVILLGHSCSRFITSWLLWLLLLDLELPCVLNLDLNDRRFLFCPLSPSVVLLFFSNVLSREKNFPSCKVILSVNIKNCKSRFYLKSTSRNIFPITCSIITNGNSRQNVFDVFARDILVIKFVLDFRITLRW